MHRFERSILIYSSNLEKPPNTITKDCQVIFEIFLGCWGCWDVHGASYPSEEDKLCDLVLLTEARKKIQEQGLAPATVGPIRKIGP
jgi:hypothetical protein